MSKPRLEGKVALITSASSGTGEAAARLFVNNGALVVVADIQDDLGLQVVESIGVDKANYFHCDVIDEKQVEATVNHSLVKYVCLDILFSNVGIMGPLGPILDLDLSQFDDTFGINVRGVAATIKHAAKAMVKLKLLSITRWSNMPALTSCSAMSAAWVPLAPSWTLTCPSLTTPLRSMCEG